MKSISTIGILLCVLTAVVQNTESACSTQLISSGLIQSRYITASSEATPKSTSQVLTDGWCAKANQQGEKWIEFDLGGSGMGISGILVGPQKSEPRNHFKTVVFQYAPVGSHNVIDFPFTTGKFEIHAADKPTTQNVSFTGLPASKIRIILKSWEGNPCLNVELTGCTITELCSGDCQNYGVCVQENFCQCPNGYTGTHCEIKSCVPVDIPMSVNMLTVSSQDSYYAKDHLIINNNGGSNRGWCPTDSDKSPSVKIKLSKPLAVSIFKFNYPDRDQKHPENQFMREFELQFIAPTDSSRLFRTFTPNIPALNGTVYLTVTIQPVIVTDTIRIVPSSWEKRACFKLQIQGCDPDSFCSTGFCKNGGTCMGNNVCLCPSGFYGDSCQITNTSITSYNLGFTKIENNVLYTNTYTFTITGAVTLSTISNENVLTINGSGSSITIDKSQIPSSCFADIDRCTTGLTIGLDINFKTLVDNTFIISSGGNLPGYKGLALYFHQNQLVYIVSTSTRVWTLNVKYQPVLNKWHHFEITWNANLGIGLYVDGHLLGTFGRPSTRPEATKTASLCIGCSHTISQVVVNMLVKGIQTWGLDRTNLVNARVVPAVTTPPPPATTKTTAVSATQTSSSFASTTSTTHSKTTTAVEQTSRSSSTAALTTQSKTTTAGRTSSPSTSIAGATPFNTTTTTDTSPSISHPTTETPTTTTPSFQSYNLTFQSIIGNILITPAFNFTVHGNPVLNLQEKGQTALVLNGSKQYVELPDKGIPCLEKIFDCQNGFTMKLEVKFTYIDITQTTYILSSGGDVSGSSGTALYLQGNQLVFAVKQGLWHWTGSFNVTTLIKLNLWYNIEVSWSMKGIIVIINGNTVIDVSRGTPYPGTSVTHPVLIGKTEGANYTAFMMVRNLFTWTASREVLVSQGVVSALTSPEPMSTTVSAATSAQTTHTAVTKVQNAGTTQTLSSATNQTFSSMVTPTTEKVTTKSTTNMSLITTKPTQTTEESTTVGSNKTSTAKKPASTTTETPTPTLTSISPTKPPIVEYLWNFTTSVQSNTTVYGQTIIKEGGMVFQNSSQFIDFGNKIECLTNPDKCHKGLTIQFSVQFIRLEENTYLLTSGGETPNGVGFAVVYRYGRLQFILSTVTHSWFASCGRDILLNGGYHLIMVSWHQTTGLYVYIDNYLIDFSKIPTPHETTVTTVKSVYFGKPHFSLSISVRVDYLIQMVHIWYARIEILIQQGICQPPHQGTTTVILPTTPPGSVTTKRTAGPPVPSSSTTQIVPAMTTTKLPTSSPTKQIPTVTFTYPQKPSTVQQCPAGCVSIGTNASPTTPSTSTPSQRATETASTSRPKTTAVSTKGISTKTTSTPRPKPTASSTPKYPQTPPPPNTAWPATATTARSIPVYHEIPKLHALLGKDKNAYLACTFNGATETNVVFTVSLLIQGQVVLTATVTGNTGIYLFSVADINDNLHQKQIRCSLKASYSGSSLTTNTTFSNIFIPQFQVTPNRLTVTEGHSAGHVTVTSTAPPQFYCCKGCKGRCQIHIVTSWTYDRHDLKCDNHVIAQAVIGSTKPQTYNKYICGFALTVQNWNQGSRIPVKATIDGRRDGDHKNTLKILANIYNQPVGVTITTRPAITFQITTVEVLIKDNHRTATCKSVNDPHMTTFDGQRYDNMHEGQFVLYRHKTEPFEVRADYQRCRPNSRAYCNCAVAVKSGDDVITIAGCQGNDNHGHHGHGIGLIMQQLFGHHNGHGHGHASTPMTIQMYINGQLTPGTYVRRYGCGQKYEIELPTGTVITVQQSYKPFINIWITASSSDWQQTEGLCGSFDGHRTNDLMLSSCRTQCVSQFIAHWKAPVNANFFLGVGVSSVVTGDMYCSCVEGKESICSPGLGVMKCSKSRYDVTSVLVQQAKKPILKSRSKRQAVPTTPTTLPDTDSGVSLDEAREYCHNAIMNNTVTESCTPILTSNVSDRIEDCAKDYNATGMQEWAFDHIRDIAFDCVEAVKSLDSANGTNSTNITASIDVMNILANTCVDACVHGSCTNGICECEDSYSGETCNISSSTKPVVTTVPFLCDMTQTTDCQLAMIYGNNFVKSDKLTCHLESIEVGDSVTATRTSSSSKAVYISLNQVACLLPSHTSASIKISNDGTTLSDTGFQHIIYNPDCHDCFLVNDTLEARCSRKTDSCIISGVCYRTRQTSPDDSCHVCLPENNNSSWSANTAAECVGVPLRQKADDNMERTSIIILAVVCAVFGALIIFGTIYICRKRKTNRKKKGSADYDVAPLHRSPTKEAPSNSMDNPTYIDYKL